MSFRLSSLASSNLHINEIITTQKNMLEYQTQITTQKVSQDYAGIATESRRVINLENTRDELERYIKTNDHQQTRLDIASTAIEHMRKSVNTLKNQLAVFNQNMSKAKDEVDSIQAAAFRSYQDLRDMLSVEVDGRYLFAGSRAATDPVNFKYTTLAEFQAVYDGARVTVPTTRSAHLERFSFSEDELNKTKQFIDPSSFLQFRQDSDGDTTTAASSTITASSALFANVTTGSTITVANTTSNNGSYTVNSISADGRTITINTELLTTESAVAASSVVYRDPSEPTKTVTLGTSNYGTLAFNRSNSTITAANSNSLSDIPVGAYFTIAGTSKNNGTFTVKTNNGTNIVVETVSLADEGLSSGNTFFDMFTDTDVNFTASSKTITVRRSGTSTAVADIFNGLAVGDKVTIAGSGSNNNTLTVASVSADGSAITVDESLTDETDTSGLTVTGSGNAFTYTSGTRVVFTNVGAAGNDTIAIQNNSGTAVAGAFSNLSVGMTVNASGTASNNSAFTITAISANGSTITVAENITTTESDTNGAELKAYSASGSISATPYYNGDEFSLSHRLNETRSFEFDVNAASSAFEKALRGIKLIMQGGYGSEGSLENHDDRISSALWMLNASLEVTAAGTPPFGDETEGSFEQIQYDVGYNQVLLDQTNKRHKSFVAFLNDAIADTENIDPAEAITRMLDEQRALEASFQTFARMRQMSLVNFL